MDAAAIARWRMHSLSLWSADAADARSAMTAVVASQAQDYLPGTWSIAQRTARSRSDEVPTHRDVAEAYDRGELIRTHVLRPTWHFVAPQDLRWLLTATAPRVHRINAYYNKQLGVDPTTVTALQPTLERALATHHRTRAQLGQAMAEAGIEASGPRLAYLLMYAELSAWICSGRRSGNQHTYALFDERIPAPDDRSREEALRQLAWQYFATRGPATAKDLAGWASLTLGEVAAARAALGDELNQIDLAGRTYLYVGDVPEIPAADGVIDLVQCFDECIMSYSESKDVLIASHRDPPGPLGAFTHAILCDGQLIGRWRYTRDSTGRPDTVIVRIPHRLGADQDAALAQAVRRFGAFAGGAASLGHAP